MIKVANRTVEVRGTLPVLLNDLTEAMNVIREGAYPESDERQIDELFTIAIELSKKNDEEITPEYRKTVHEMARERLSKTIKEGEENDD